MCAKILVLGLDGATFKLMKPWIDNDELSFISRLLKNGSHGMLEAFLPPTTPVEWASFYTGKNPGNLGIFAFSLVADLKKSYDEKIIDASAIKSPTIWDLLSQQGKNVGVVNIPSTYPPEHINGFIISGLPVPESSQDYFHPPELRDFMSDYNIDLELRLLLPEGGVDKKSLLEEAYLVAEKRTKTVLALLKKHRLDFFAIDFIETDVIQHLFWDNRSVLLNFYKMIDSYAENIHEAFNPTHTIIMSDHGFHEAESDYFYINSWLEKKGYLVRSSELRGRFLSWLYTFGVKLARRSERLRGIIPESLETKMMREYAGYQIDFSKSAAYASRWGIFISDKIRETAEYSDFRKKLKKNISQAEDPRSREKVFKSVFEREELFYGKYLEKFPDLIPVPNTRYMPNPNMTRYLFEPRVDHPYLTGAHSSDPYGIFIIQGEGIRKNLQVSGVKIIDLAPTILHLFGFDKPQDMDGRVIHEIFEKDYVLAKKAVKYEAREAKTIKEHVWSKEEEEAIKNRLRRLGYL